VPDKLEQASLGMIVVTIGRHMRGQLVYPTGKQGYLHLGRTGIAFAGLIFTDYFRLLLFVQSILLPPYIINK
jgi:hypothetical protein